MKIETLLSLQSTIAELRVSDKPRLLQELAARAAAALGVPVERI